MKVERCEGKPASEKHRDELIVRAVEDMQERANRWWHGRQGDALVIAVRNPDASVTVFDTMLRRAIELDEREGDFAEAADVRAALDKVCS